MEELMRKHELQIKLLDAISCFHSFSLSTADNIKRYKTMFPNLVAKYEHKLEIYEMCINRLKERYNKI